MLKKPTVTFLGYKNTFDFEHLGGMDSFYRRLSSTLLSHQHQVQFLLYGFDDTSTECKLNQLQIIKTTTFKKALGILNQTTGPVIVNALHRNNRLHFIYYRFRHKNRPFHLVYSVFSENRLSRNLYLLETFLYPYNGIGICLSHRLQSLVKARRNNACTFLPPVDTIFFKTPTEINRTKPIQISFFGRIDPGKGTQQFREIASHFKDDSRFEFHMYGYIWPWSKICRKEEEIIQKQPFITYHKSKHTSYNPNIDLEVVRALHKTDILILPYKKLSSTADMPLLLLEGMAASCCVILPDLGNLADVYGQSPFILGADNLTQNAIKLIKNIDKLLKAEKQRVHLQVRQLQLNEEETYERLLNLKII